MRALAVKLADGLIKHALVLAGVEVIGYVGRGGRRVRYVARGM